DYPAEATPIKNADGSFSDSATVGAAPMTFAAEADDAHLRMFADARPAGEADLPQDAAVRDVSATDDGVVVEVEYASGGCRWDTERPVRLRANETTHRMAVADPGAADLRVRSAHRHRVASDRRHRPGHGSGPADPRPHPRGPNARACPLGRRPRSARVPRVRGDR